MTISQPMFYCQSSEKMEQCENNSIALTVTSPPYWDAIDYDRHKTRNKDGQQVWYRERAYSQFGDSIESYLDNIESVFKEVNRVTLEGGFCAIVIGTLLQNGYHYPLPMLITSRMMEIGWEFHQDIIWNKVTGGVKRAGSYIQHQKSGYYYPNIMTEYILVFRKPGEKRRGKSESHPIDTVFKYDVANNVWHIAPVPPRTIDHPCPYPMELVRRLILLYSDEGDSVLDPFLGSGQTALAALKLNRKSVGYDIEQKYIDLSMERIASPALLSILIFDNKTFIAYYCVILHFTMQKMQVQQTILATLRSDLPTLSELVTSNQDKSRQALGKLICSKFKLLNTKGRPRISGCMKALYVLEEEGHVSLPKPQTASFVRGPRLLEESVPAPVDVPADVRQIQDLEILLVTGSQARAIWNTLLAREHPKGTTTFAGAQVRYLIRSTSGYLGAVGFSAAALHLGARDAWMAWDLSTRMQNLYRVANLSRFLIRPEVRCKNLASSILARVLHRLPSDFMARYDYAPYVVETFVGPDYDGTCFRAAGFHYLGRTKGQGRHASATDAPKSKKKIFAYELDPNWRTHLGVPSVDLYPRLEPGTGLDADHWANQEFGRAELGDRRRTARLVKSVRLMANTVGTPSTASPKRDSAALQGYYRFFAKADELGISNEDIHAPHLQRTIERMRTQETVLFIQDGTKLSFTTRTNTEGFDVIGENQTSAKAYGIHLHATIAVSAEEGLPLGIVNCSYGKQTPKTQTWLDGLHAVEKASETLPRKTRAICVMDREADAFEILSEQRALQRTEILVRAKHDRVLDKSKNTRLFRTMRKGSPAGLVELKVEDLSRRMKSGRVTSEGRPGRNARMEIRFRKVMLPPTKDPAQAPMPVWGIHLRELNPPEDAKPIEWYLVTTQEVTSLKEAQQMINYYKLRWRVEDTFRVLKSGCKVEKLRFQKPKVLHRVLTVYMIITWRIMLMTLMGRVAGDLEMEVFFRGSEAKMLQVYAENYRLPVPTNVSSAILTVAMMGGYMNRKHDPPPGHEIMWRGYSSLQIRAVAYEELEAIGKVNW